MKTTMMVWGALAACTFAGAAQAGMLQSSYLSAADSPLANMTTSYFHLEDFELGALTVPGVTIDQGVVYGPSPASDSVDGDDGIVDGIGTLGHLWFVSSWDPVTVRIDFDENVLGNLPNFAGLVWTDGVNGSTATLTGYDADGNEVDSISSIVGAPGNPNGDVNEDMFFGLEATAGIAYMTISTSTGSIEFDHLQYAFAPIPAPSALALLALGGVTRRRRRG